MTKYKIFRKTGNFYFFIALIILLLGFSFFYFFYTRVRNQEELYVTIAAGKNSTSKPDTSFNWLPYWLADSIEIGDKDVNPLGGSNMIVVEKNSYEAGYYGQNVYLLLKMKAVHDRSGIYLYKNKPLSVGSVIDLNLTKTQVQGLVIKVDKEKPNYTYKKLKVTLHQKAVNREIADSLKVGSEIKDNKKMILAVLLDKQIAPPISSSLYLDSSQRSLKVTVELLVKKIDDNYYYAETSKVKVNEWLFLPFKEVGLFFPIISITEIQ